MTERKTALVTGASSGFGAVFARLFAQDGHDVVLVARREERLRALAAQLEEQHGGKAHVVAADLADPGAPPRVFATTTNDLGLHVSFLVNNAGYGALGPFLEHPYDDETGMVEVNVGALHRLAHLYGREMVARGFGRILNVASTAGFQPGPFMATYYASKAFVVSFSEALAVELGGTGVTVTCACPGAATTEFAARAGNDKAQLFAGRLLRGNVLDAESAARHAYRAMMNGDVIAIPGLMNKAGVLLAQLGPRPVVRRAAAWVNSRAKT